jgi:glycosyltransferase involved in cell wall biosynthesis
MVSKTLRVAMLAPPWLPIPPDGYGGLENVLDALIPELMKLGVEVELFTVGESTVEATKKHWLYEKGQYEHIHRPGYDSAIISVAHMQFALNAIARDGNFDLIHDHTIILGPLALANLSDDFPPVLHTLHNPPFTNGECKKLNVPDNLPMWEQFKDAKKLYFTCISKAMAACAPRGFRRRMLPVVHNTVDVCNFPFVDKKDDHFMTLARFDPEKGQALAVQACLELGYRLKMAGAVAGITKYRKVVLELANPLSAYRSVAGFRYFSDQIFPYLEDDLIEYVGEVAGATKMKFISRAKALLAPIQWEEPFGMVTIEALACGTPVVALNRGAMPEIIQHGVNGFLANNMREFKQYMQRVEEIDPAACRASVEKKFSARTIAKKYLNRYHTIVEKHKI